MEETRIVSVIRETIVKEYWGLEDLQKGIDEMFIKGYGIVLMTSTHVKSAGINVITYTVIWQG